MRGRRAAEVSCVGRERAEAAHARNQVPPLSLEEASERAAGLCANVEIALRGKPEVVRRAVETLVAGDTRFELGDPEAGGSRNLGTGPGALPAALALLDLPSVAREGSPEAQAAARALLQGGARVEWLLRDVVEVVPPDHRPEHELGHDLDALSDWVMGHAEALGRGRLDPEERQAERRSRRPPPPGRGRASSPYCERSDSRDGPSRAR